MNQNKPNKMVIKLIEGQTLPFSFPDDRIGSRAEILDKTGINTLFIRFEQYSKQEIKAFREGEIKMGMLYDDGDMLLLFSFLLDGKPYFSCDAPFDARLTSSKNRLALPNIMSEYERLPILIIVMDAEKKIEVIRYIMMPHELTVKFLSSVQDQLSSLSSGEKLPLWYQKSIPRTDRSLEIWRVSLTLVDRKVYGSND